MTLWIKMAHLLALALWTGAVFFFSFFIALPVIDGMKKWAMRAGNWLGLQNEQQGTRLAGEFLDIIFGRYFYFQAICGFIALSTGLLWIRTPGWIAKVRLLCVLVALVGALLNAFILAPQVHALRQARYGSDPSAAAAANAAFGSAHTWSLAVDLIGLGAIITALCLFPWCCQTTPNTGRNEASAHQIG